VIALAGVYLSVCLFVKHYTNSYRLIWLKFSEQVRLGPA